VKGGSHVAYSKVLCRHAPGKNKAEVCVLKPRDGPGGKHQHNILGITLITIIPIKHNKVVGKDGIMRSLIICTLQLIF
jgi:hypothetical protein